jgi:hypothetical protein
MSDHFIYHAFAIGVSGRITAPFDEIIPVQASCALPEGGGFGTSRVDDFQFRNILSFGSADAVVAGSDSPADNNSLDGLTEFEKQKTTPDPKGPSHDAVATVIVEGLNVLSIVTADRIVARIASSHPFDIDKPSSITPIGSYFENLRIAGHKITLDLALDRFAKFDTAQSVRDAFENNTDNFRDEFKRMSLIREDVRLPQRLCKYLPWRGWDSDQKIPEKNGIIACSLVRNIEGLGPELTPYGHVIHVKGFGVIRLAELKITNSARRLTMLHIDLGSTPTGSVGVCGAEGNGDGY